MPSKRYIQAKKRLEASEKRKKKKWDDYMKPYRKRAKKLRKK